MKINKKRIFIIIVLLFLVIKSINIVFRQPIKEVVQTWPLSTNPNGVRLRIPVGYIDSDVMWFEPLLEKDKPPKKPEDKTGIELFNAWPICKLPVTFGGGITIENFFEFFCGRNNLFFSQYSVLYFAFCSLFF